MSRSVRAAHRTFRPGLLPALRQWLSIFLSDAGLTQTSAETQANQVQAMSASAHHHRTLLSLPRDFIRRRRLRRRWNAILIPLLSGVAAYFITRKTSPGRAAQGDSILGYTNCASLAFGRPILKADPAAKIYLQSDALPEFSHRVVKLSRR